MDEKDKTPTQPTAPAAPAVSPATPTQKPEGGLDSRIRAAVKGLMFQTNREVRKEGEPTRFVPAERPMRREDVLAAKLDGTVLVLVTADGRKHRVTEKAA